MNRHYSAIVVGAGHAGCEAALALARTGIETLLLAINLDSVAFLACNPSIGGTAKGHLVREIDALGGEMGRCADKTLIHLRMLNESKGAAVQSLRAQVDKHAYHSQMKRTLEQTPKLLLRQAEVAGLIVQDGRVCGVQTPIGDFTANAVILACGVYLNSTVIVGEHQKKQGPNGFAPASHLTSALNSLGFATRRFKTGTPARIDGRTIDYSVLEEQRGDASCIAFSHICTHTARADLASCYLGYTTEETKRLILSNLHRAPMYSGRIKGTGARYCPSIEDKIVRFSDKERHQFFLEPEGLDTHEMYVSGISTSLPYDVQEQMYKSLDGMKNAEIMRPAYAIEYDCIDSLELFPTLESKRIKNLYFAGQLNGTSGYEEAAAQGLVAGLNASLRLRGLPPLTIGRSEGYMGVLLDDLVTKGVDEPYRMMSSRAEYRLLLRQDNADTRLTEKGIDAGLVFEEQRTVFEKKQADKAKLLELLDTSIKQKTLAPMFAEAGEPAPSGAMTLAALIKRLPLSPAALAQHVKELANIDMCALVEVVNTVRYEGYIARQNAILQEVKRLEDKALPKMDYMSISGLRLEARQKLTKVQPTTLAQAARIPGVTPADINVLIVLLG